MTDKTINQLLPDFYKKYNLPPDGGQSESSVKVEITSKIHFFIPNWDGRRKAVLRHDVHHIVTGYESLLKGEAEIAAWEIASGCANYPSGLLINSQGPLMGLVCGPFATFKAFKKGRRTTNLYHSSYTEDQFLSMTVPALQEHLKLANYKAETKTTIQDVLSFISWNAFSVLIAILSIGLLPFLVLFNLKCFLIPNPSKQKI